MKSFEEFRQEQLAEQEQLDEINPLAWAASGLKWLGDKAFGVTKNVAGKVVGEVGKTAKKAWDGGDTKISGVKGTDEKGLPSVN